MPNNQIKCINMICYGLLTHLHFHLRFLWFPFGGKNLAPSGSYFLKSGGHFVISNKECSVTEPQLWARYGGKVCRVVSREENRSVGKVFAIDVIGVIMLTIHNWSNNYIFT